MLQPFIKGLAAALAGLFVVTAVLALLLFNLDRRGFAADTYRRALATQEFYDRFPTKLAQALAVATGERGNLPVVIKGLPVESWEVFVRALLPPETLRPLGDQALESIFEYLNGNTDVAQVSLSPLKAKMNGESGVQAVFLLLGTQPDCTLTQVAAMTLALLQQSTIQLCNPPAGIHGLITPLVQAQLALAAAALPEQVVFADARASSPASDPRQRLRRVRLLMRLSPLIPLALLLGITLLTVRTLVDLLRWWGLPISLTGALAALLSLTGAPVVGLLLRPILVRTMAAYLPAILLDYAGDLAAAMVDELLKPLLWQGLVLAVTGIAMLAIALLRPHRLRAR